MKKTMTYEEGLFKLEQTVEKLENGELPLDQSLKLYEEGMALFARCSEILDQAEQKVSLLQKKGDTMTEIPFEEKKEADS